MQVGNKRGIFTIIRYSYFEKNPNQRQLSTFQFVPGGLKTIPKVTFEEKKIFIVTSIIIIVKDIES